jgi:polyhydroxyalkanoate synthesis regulator phasin
VEDVQDRQKLDVTVRRFTQDFEGLSREWVDRGTMTEQEARNLVASLLQGQPYSPEDGYRTITTTANTVPPSSAAHELKELTAQIAQLRSELEKLQGNSNG